ncbi:MAG: HDOD domain-containing protein [Bryobacteraceae bacterium]
MALSEESITGKLESCVRSILSSAGFPGCSQHIQELQALAAMPDSSGPELTQVILKDVSLTVNVLRSANSALYNRSGKAILSMAHAVALLGLERIGQIASAVKFLQHFGPRDPGMRELVTLSLLSASQARRLAHEIGYARPEEAHLCALLRNLGEVLVAYYQPRQYAAVLVQMKAFRLTPQAASRKVLGFTYEDLAARVLEHWRIGGRVLACLATTDTLAARSETDEAALHDIVGFSHRATEVVHRNDPRAARSALRHLIEKHGARFQVSESTLNEILRLSVNDARDSFTALGVTIDSLKLHCQVERAMAMLLDPDPGEDDESCPADRAVLDLEGLVHSGDEFDLTHVIGGALEAAIASGAYRRSIFALVDNDRAEVEGKFGRGENSEIAIAQFRFPVSVRSIPVGPALLRQQDLVVDLGSDDGYRRSSLVQLLNPGSFGLFPIVVDRILVGCLYVDRPEAGGAIPKPDLARLHRLRDALAAAIDRKRS